MFTNHNTFTLRFIAYVLLFFVGVSYAHADIWDMYDGNGDTPLGSYDSQAGVTCLHYNAAAGLFWNNKGGDWVDADGVMQGSKPFATTSFPITSTPIERKFDITRMANPDGIIVRREGGVVVSVASRESARPPKLTLTMADGSTRVLLPVADASLKFASQDTCISGGLGKSSVMTVNPTVVIGFGKLPSGYTKAELTLSIESAGNKGKLEIYQMVIPKETLTKVPYVNTGDPEVIFHENWETKNWWDRLGTGRKPTAQWTHDDGMFIVPGGAGVWWANGDPTPIAAPNNPGTFLQRGTGYSGKGVTFVYNPTVLAAGVDLYDPSLKALNGGQELDEAWLTYMVKYGPDWHSFAKCEGGKAAGLTGVNTYCANSGTSANGYCGWSLRMSYKVMCDQQNPAFPRVPFYTYAYHGAMTGYYGQNWLLNEAGLLELDKWYCVEQHVKVNTPGKSDGKIEVFINETLALSKDGIYLRGEKPSAPLGYGSWWLDSQYPAPLGAPTVTDSFGRKLWLKNNLVQDTDLGINRVFNVFHNGGVTPPGKTAQMWMDEMKVSKRRAGCPSPGNPPTVPTTPPASVTITATPSSIMSGSSTQISWSSANATSCTASGGWSGNKSLSGSEVVPSLSATTTFSINCVGLAGSGTDSVTVAVKKLSATSSTPTPPVTSSSLPNITLFSVNQNPVFVGSSTQVSWSVTGANVCVFGGSSWAGATAANVTTQSNPIISTTTISLNCGNQLGTSTKSVVVGIKKYVPTTTTTTTTTPPPATPPSTSTSGGGGAPSVPVVSTSGGSSGGGSYVPPVTTTPSPIVSSVTPRPTIDTERIVFALPLKQGDESEEVRKLQRVLNMLGYTISSVGVGAPGNETTYFGKATERALQNFQRAQGIVTEGTPSTTGYGSFGPRTIIALQNVLNSKQSSSTVSPITSNLPTSTTSAIVSATVSGSLKFTRALRLGSIGDDVLLLQQFLNKKGYLIAQAGAGSPGNETKYFGNATKNALIKYQEANAGEILVPNGLIRGTGIFGPSTIKHVERNAI